MSLNQTKIGEKDGKDIFLFTLDNNKGLRAEILNYGGIVKRLEYNGTDVVRLDISFTIIFKYFGIFASWARLRLKSRAILC